MLEKTFLETAQRRDPTLRLANMLGYKSKETATRLQGMLKIISRQHGKCY